MTTTGPCRSAVVGASLIGLVSLHFVGASDGFLPEDILIVATNSREVQWALRLSLDREYFVEPSHDAAQQQWKLVVSWGPARRLVEFAVVMFMAIFSIHSSFSWHEMDEKATASVVTKTSHEDFKRLMDQTKQLLNDMAAANSTLTLDTLRDFKALTWEEKRMGEQNEALEREVDRLETALTHCLKGKYDAETSLDTCKREFKDYQVVYNKDTSSSATKTVKCPDVPVNVEPPQPPPAAVDETKWLVIGIPTVARRNDLDYLLKTLAAMVDQLPLDRDDPLYRRVLVHVINMQVNSDPHPRHVVFDQAKGLYGPGSGSPYAPYFKFSELLASEVE
eukprot:gene12863-14819_t